MTLKKFDVNRYLENEKAISEIVFMDDSHFVFKIHGNHIDGTYEIERNACKTPEQIISWIFHLTGKQWMNREILIRFIKLASDNANINL